MALQELHLSGDSFTIGYQHGHRLAEEIVPRVQCLWRSISRETGATLRLIRKTRKLIDKICPEVNLEIKGISEAAQLTFESVFLYNNRDLVGFSESDSCSQFVSNMTAR